MGKRLQKMDEVPQPRLCHVKKWPNFDGYGFNLLAEKNKPGQFIGAVDANSPAEAAGLLQGDRIVEVNGVNVSQENHKQVVQRIKAIPDETKLLVVDQKCEGYHKANEIVIKGSLSYVKYLSSDSDPKKEIVDGEQTDESHVEKASSDEDSSEEDTDDEKRSNKSSGVGDDSSIDREKSNSKESGTNTNQVIVANELPSKKMESARSLSGLDLNMSAKEMRERIGSKKKKDARKENSMDFMKKLQIVQSL